MRWLRPSIWRLSKPRVWLLVSRAQRSRCRPLCRCKGRRTAQADHREVRRAPVNLRSRGAMPRCSRLTAPLSEDNADWPRGWVTPSPLAVRLSYGVGVAAASAKTATVTTQATASSAPSLRTSPAMLGGKRAESPSLSVNSVPAGIASGSVGTGVPALTARDTVMSLSTLNVAVPDATYTRTAEGSAGSKGTLAPGARFTRPNPRLAVPGARMSIEPDASVRKETGSGVPAAGADGGVASWAATGPRLPSNVSRTTRRTNERSGGRNILIFPFICLRCLRWGASGSDPDGLVIRSGVLSQAAQSATPGTRGG